MDSSCVSYTGAPLTCSGISTDDSVEVAIQKIDAILCSSSGDYSTYEKNCLNAYWGSPITTESAFVNAVSNFVCRLRTDLDGFISTTYAGSIASINNYINGILNPSITCSSASITPSDGYIPILNKYCSKFSSIDTAIDISSVVWNNCFTVITTPTTIAEGFQLLSDQICSINTGSITFPTFNNIGSCLPGTLTASDTLEDTINKIKTKLCGLPSYNYSNIIWGCIGTPTSVSLEAGLQKIVNKVNQVVQTLPTFDSGDFVVTQTNPLDACAGLSVSLATPINQDRLVAATSGDLTPGVLQDKLQQGTNVTLDYATTPGKVIISASGTADTKEVLASYLDDTPGFLVDKLNGGGNSGITVSPTYNLSLKKVELGVDVDLDTLFNLMLSALDSNADLYSKFCEKVRNCPSPCIPPTNVQAVQVMPTTTTTTTTGA